MKTEEFKNLSRIRNGVETIPSILRRKYRVDELPVRDLNHHRFWLSTKIGALNFKNYAQNPAMPE